MPETPADVAAAPADSTKTESGLAWKVLQAGTGDEKPTAADTVTVHYSGWTTDGAMFDSSVERGESTSFPLGQVIAGWTEGLQLIKTGGKVKLVIPPELGYGPQGAPPKIPGGSTLTFEVELFTISAGDAKAAKAPKKK